GGPNAISDATTFTRTFSGTAAINSPGGSILSTVNPELSPATSVSAAYTIGVYSGFMKWSGVSGGAWGTGSNWTDSVSGGVPAAPGLDGGFTLVDSATFGNTSGSVTVNLDGAAPSLSSMTFNGTGSYTVAKGTGSGSITLGGTSPAITAAGTQIISAPIVLASNAQVTVTGS
ncbi:MAG: hypothetical protein NTW03_12600, partial [Verrucomicrobia bacterium]|nr:hypothetical protein [Verrucomicrobiota bacterium]